MVWLVLTGVAGPVWPRAGGSYSRSEQVTKLGKGPKDSRVTRVRASSSGSFHLPLLALLKLDDIFLPDSSLSFFFSLPLSYSAAQSRMFLPMETVTPAHLELPRYLDANSSTGGDRPSNWSELAGPSVGVLRISEPVGGLRVENERAARVGWVESAAVRIDACRLARTCPCLELGVDGNGLVAGGAAGPFLATGCVANPARALGT